MIRINLKQPPQLKTLTTGMIYQPNYLSILDWEWDSVNLEVIINPGGPQQCFVEWCTGWRESGELKFPSGEVNRTSYVQKI
jgi:hypothetical protein